MMRVWFVPPTVATKFPDVSTATHCFHYGCQHTHKHTLMSLMVKDGVFSELGVEHVNAADLQRTKGEDDFSSFPFFLFFFLLLTSLSTYKMILYVLL